MGSGPAIATPPAPPSVPPGRPSGLLQQLARLLLWVLVALLLRWTVVEPRWIPSGSMLPTLQLQDRVLVEKLSPRFGSGVRTGRIVVFHPPAALQQAGYDPGAALIKRVVAVAGDRVEVKGGRLWRNGIPAEPDWALEPMDYALEPFEVPPGQVLVLGDNRNASLDSHLWGPLPESDLIGTAIWRYWPLDRFGPVGFSTPHAGEAA
ncbi:signal peptidase I [Cyanobium sp. N.Huapi 1H5]|uniref:signal peptidase I n=1 Tax=Cyanobium sp. N.Huapi 1H5 TaxID=2823719 RepID=UPI0020CFDCD5|nr:signal peptidase I [Cyanobium sp. N.Huapi 1H5]